MFFLYFLPINQWAQLKSGRKWWFGEHLTSARKGWMKQRPTVTKPIIACGFVLIVSESPLSSSRMRIKPATVRPQVNTMKFLCHMNHWSKLKHLFDVQVCLKYLRNKCHWIQKFSGVFSHLAMMIPKLAEQIQAPIMNAPCRKINNLDFDFKGPTSPKPLAVLDTILSLSCFWMSPVSLTLPLANITWYCSVSRSHMIPPVKVDSLYMEFSLQWMFHYRWWLVPCVSRSRKSIHPFGRTLSLLRSRPPGPWCFPWAPVYCRSSLGCNLTSWRAS